MVSFVSFFREVVGVASVTPEVLMSRTAPDRAWVTRSARSAHAHGSPLMAAPKDRRTAAVVAPSSQRGTAAEGIGCILPSVERGRTFVSSTPRSAPSGGDPADRLIHAARKRFLHDSCSLLDPLLGPLSRRVATVLPCTLACFLNGQ